MINIDTYVDCVFSEIKYIDLDIITINAFIHSQIRTNKLFTNRTVFDEKRKAVFDLHLIDFEGRKKANIFKENDFLENIKKETQTAIESYKTWVIVKNTKIDLERIDFQELAFIAGMCDFFNFCEADTQQETNTKKKLFNLRPKNIDIDYMHDRFSTIIEISLSQCKKLFNSDGFEVFGKPIEFKQGTTIKHVACAFDDLYRDGKIYNNEWKATLEKAKVFKHPHTNEILHSLNFTRALSEINNKNVRRPKRLFSF